MIGWAVILFAGGVTLLLAEFVIPGMVCGILGTALIIGSAVVASQAYPDYIPLILLAELLGVVAAVLVGMYFLPRSRAAKHLILTDSQDPAAGWVASDTDAIVGAEGTVFTALRPAGTIVVNGKRMDAVANGSFIDKGEPIRIIEAHGSRVVVERIDGT